MFELQFIYTGVLEDLSPLCTYEYQVGTYFYWSDVRRVSGLTPGSDINQPVSLGILGDMGIGSNSSASRALLTDLTVNQSLFGVLHLGDIAYNLGDFGGYVGDQYLEDIEPIASRIAYMTMPGNHEHYTNFTQYKRRFHMPVASSSGHYYSFDFGKAHFTILDSETYFYQDSYSQNAQQEWLIEDLRRANDNRVNVPWLLVFAHKPLYCSIDWRLPIDNPHTNNNCGEQATLMRKMWEELFYDNRVDVYFAGHVHNYQRMTSIYHNQTVQSDHDTFSSSLNPKAPIYILSGDAGSDHGHEPLSTTPQLWNVYGDESFGFGKLTVYNETHLEWIQYNAEAVSIADSLWVVRN
jgi:hypothetical protein